eukprot:3824277-Ditylum_brightwellii.AAC.2
MQQEALSYHHDGTGSTLDNALTQHNLMLLHVDAEIEVPTHHRVPDHDKHTTNMRTSQYMIEIKDKN